MKKLSERALLFMYTRSAWGAKKNEKEVEREAEQKHGTKKGMVKATKFLLPEEALEEGNRAANEARAFLYEQTLPYDDKGWRLVTTKNYFDFTGKMQAKISAIENADKKFLAEYSRYRDQAKIDLNGLFKEEDYPTVEQIAKKFSATCRTIPLPDASNYPGDMQSIIDDLSKDLAEREREVTDNAMHDVWNRLYKVVESASDALSDPDKTFRDTLITNIQDVCELLPRLNLTDDPDLERLRQEVQTKLTNINPEDLRQKNGTGWMEQGIRAGNRKMVATEAQKILKDMEGYFTPPDKPAAKPAPDRTEFVNQTLNMILS